MTGINDWDLQSRFDYIEKDVTSVEECARFVSIFKIDVLMLVVLTECAPWDLPVIHFSTNPKEGESAPTFHMYLSNNLNLLTL